MMNLLAELRGRGACVSLSDAGKLLLKSVPNDRALISRAQAGCEAITKALRIESIGGESYINSALHYQVERLVELVITHKESDIAPGACRDAIDLLFEIADTGMNESLKIAAQLCVTRYASLRELFVEIETDKRSTLGGKALHQAARQVFSQKPGRNVAAFG